MESGAIKQEQISVSSCIRRIVKNTRLHDTEKTWIADWTDSTPWLQLDLRAQHTKVTRVATQGSHRKSYWVEKYKLQYSNYGVRFQYYREQGQTIAKVKQIRGGGRL